MKDIVSLLKKSAKNFDKISQTGKRLIPSTLMKKCGFKDTGEVNYCSHLYKGDERPVKIMRLLPKIAKK